LAFLGICRGGDLLISNGPRRGWKWWVGSLEEEEEEEEQDCENQWKECLENDKQGDKTKPKIERFIQQKPPNLEC
jgi:hypothetical protein